MDTAALQLLGVTPELGTEVTVSYSITDKDQSAFTDVYKRQLYAGIWLTPLRNTKRRCLILQNNRTETKQLSLIHI